MYTVTTARFKLDIHMRVLVQLLEKFIETCAKPTYGMHLILMMSHMHVKCARVKFSLLASNHVMCKRAHK